MFTLDPLRILLNPDSAEARWNPGAAKASDCEVSKSFCAFARRCYEARHPLEAPLIDVCSEAEPPAEGLRLALFVDRNCGIRAQRAVPVRIVCRRRPYLGR